MTTTAKPPIQGPLQVAVKATVSAVKASVAPTKTQLIAAIKSPQGVAAVIQQTPQEQALTNKINALEALVSSPARIAAYKTLNDLDKQLGLPPEIDRGALQIAQLNARIAKLQAQLAAKKTAPQGLTTPSSTATATATAAPHPSTTPAGNSNQGAVIPPAPNYPPVSGPTPAQAAAMASTATAAAAAAPANRTQAFAQLNALYAQLGVAPLAFDATNPTLAQLKALITKAQYSIAHPTPAATSPAPSSAPTTTKLDVVKQIDALLASAGQPPSGLDPNSLNQTQLTNTLNAVKQQIAGSTAAAPAGASTTIAGIPRKTAMIAAGALVGVGVIILIKKKKGL